MDGGAGLNRDVVALHCIQHISISRLARRPSYFGMYYVRTVHIGYSAIGYSVKSVIVSVLGWSRFLYSKNYWI